VRVVYLLCGVVICKPAWCVVDRWFILRCVVTVSVLASTTA
jgi:hypothetical protein